MPLLEAGRYEVIQTSEKISAADTLERWNFGWKVFTELWYMLIASYITYYIIVLVMSYVNTPLCKMDASHSSMNPHSLSAASSEDFKLAYIGGP